MKYNIFSWCVLFDIAIRATYFNMSIEYYGLLKHCTYRVDYYLISAAYYDSVYIYIGFHCYYYLALW